MTEELNLQNKLIASERLAAMGQAAAGLAHFIKNILNSLKGGAFMIDAGLKRPDNKLIEQGQRIIQRNITAVTDLTQDMLSLRQGPPTRVGPGPAGRVGQRGF